MKLVMSAILRANFWLPSMSTYVSLSVGRGNVKSMVGWVRASSKMSMSKSEFAIDMDGWNKGDGMEEMEWMEVNC